MFLAFISFYCLCVLFLSATLHVHFIHGQLLVHLYALLSCHAASVKCFYKSCFLWQINDDDDDDNDDMLCINLTKITANMEYLIHGIFNDNK